MNIRHYIDQLPEAMRCEKDTTVPERHARVGAVLREERERSFEETAAIPAAIIDPLF